MPSLSNHHSGDVVKMLYIGDSGTGKTGSLVSLVKAGYKMRILDTDNGLDILAKYVMKECPDKIGNVNYETRRDKYKATASGPVVAGAPKAYIDCVGLLTKWSDGTVPSEWGADTILVVDTLTGLSSAAFEWARGMDPSAKDKRQWFFTAQQSIEKVIEMLTGEEFKCNIIVISHIDYNQREDGTTKGYASAIGSALGPKLPKYFNNLILSESRGSGQNVKRMIRTLPTGVVDLKTSAPFKLTTDLDLSTGLATVFEKLKEK